METFVLFASLLCCDKSDELVAQLASKKFREREAASQQLKARMNLKLYRKLKNKTTQDLEQSRRMQFIVAEYENELCPGLWIDLQGYGGSPQIDEGMPSNYTYKGMNRWTIICHYMEKAHPEQCWEGRPHYPQYRRAFDIWMSERLQEAWKTALAKDSEQAVREFARKESELIRRDVKWLIEGDKKWYRKLGVQNPYFKEMPKADD